MKFIECQTEEHSLISTDGPMYITHAGRSTHRGNGTIDTAYSIYIEHSGHADAYMDNIPSHKECHRQIAKLLKDIGSVIVSYNSKIVDDWEDSMLSASTPVPRPILTKGEVRTARGDFTQLQFASMLQVSRAHISKIENGNRSITQSISDRIRTQFHVV